MDDRYRVGVFRADRRNILGVVDRQAPNLPDCYRLSFDGHGTKDPRHQLRFRSPLSDPARPVIEQTLAYSGGAAVDGYRQSGPDLLRRKHVARNPILNVHAISGTPVVPRRIPHRETAIGVSVDDKPGNPWPPGAPGPALVQRRVGACVAVTVARRGTYGKAQRCRCPDVRWPRCVAGGQAGIQVAGPLAGQGPPGNVEQEALAEPVVTGDQVDPRRQFQLHLVRRAYVDQLQPFKHQERRYRRLLRDAIWRRADRADRTQARDDLGSGLALGVG